MPSTTKRQAHFMSAIAHGWKPTGEKGPSRAVAEEFHDADKAQGKWEHGSSGKMEKLKGRGTSAPSEKQAENLLVFTFRNPTLCERHKGWATPDLC